MRYMPMRCVPMRCTPVKCTFMMYVHTHEMHACEVLYYRQFIHYLATQIASIIASSQLGASYPSCLILSYLARASSYDKRLNPDAAASDGRRRPIQHVIRYKGTGLWSTREDD